MPRRKDETFRAYAKIYLKNLKDRGLSKRYINRVDKDLKECCRILLEGGHTTHPKKINQEHLNYIRENLECGNSRKKYIIGILCAFVKFHGNYQKNFMWPSTIPKRPRVTREQWQVAMEGCYNAGDIIGATVLLLASLGIRRIGIWRMRPDDIKMTHISVLGKGMAGGKLRNVPISMEIYTQLQEYKSWRQQVIDRILQNNPNATVPDKLIISYRKKVMSSACVNTISEICLSAGRRVGIHLTTHMLRRMFCRELYEEAKRSGDFETSLQSAIVVTGHEHVHTFMEYVGDIEADSRNLMDRVLASRKMTQSQELFLNEKASHLKA